MHEPRTLGKYFFEKYMPKKHPNKRYPVGKITYENIDYSNLVLQQMWQAILIFTKKIQNI